MNGSLHAKMIAWGVARSELTPAQRWLTFSCVFFFAATTMYGYLKVSPVLMVIAAKYGMSLDTVGSIMSAFNIAGLLMAFPGIWIMRNFGVKLSLVITGCITLMGSIMGILTSSTEVFLVSRVFEGAGMGMVSAIGPTVMPRLFPPDKLGFAMGFWSIWTCPGILLGTLVGPQVYGMFGFVESLWMVSIIFETVSILSMLFFFRMNHTDLDQLDAKGNVKARLSLEKDLQARSYTRSGIIASITFINYTLCFGMFQNFYPTFLQESSGTGVSFSTIPATVATVIAMPISLCVGTIMNRFDLRKPFLVIGQMVIGLTMGWFAWVGSGATWIFVGVLIGFVQGTLPVAVRLLIPLQIKDQKIMDYALGTMAFMTNLGGFYSAPFGMMISSLGWGLAGIVGILPLTVICVIANIFFVRSDKE